MYMVCLVFEPGTAGWGNGQNHWARYGGRISYRMFGLLSLVWNYALMIGWELCGLFYKSLPIGKLRICNYGQFLTVNLAINYENNFYGRGLWSRLCEKRPEWPVKVAKCLQKLPKNEFTRKITDFDTFTKIAEECGRFGQINCCQRL